MNFSQLYLDGRWQAPAGRNRIDVLSASTEEVIGSIPEGTCEDVDRAVEAARRAFDCWSQTSGEERAGWLEKLSAALKDRADQLAKTIAMEVGTPISMAAAVQAGLPINVTASYAQILREAKFEHEIGNSLVLREPVGVVGAITPWNYPLHQIVAKIAPAIAAGNTVVLKPSEVAPLNANLFLRILAEAGVPNGVVNLVHGTGPVVGEAISAHPGIDMVSFTGSTA